MCQRREIQVGASEEWSKEARELTIRTLAHSVVNATAWVLTVKICH